ncbi:MAG: uracil-DNA glycosylase [Candidatus Eiseniibacteriota bacterium]
MSERDELAGIVRGARRLIERERASGGGERLASSLANARARMTPLVPAATVLAPQATPVASALATGEPESDPESLFDQATAAPPSFARAEEGPPLHPRDPQLRAAIVAESRPLLARIAEEVRACEKCALFKARTQGVPGIGSALSGIAFVGEGPGADEDRVGEPFVGRAGQLLDKILSAMNDAGLIPGLKLDRTSVFIGNIVHCRPPENRVPLPEEITQSLPYLVRQLEALKPRIICCLGKTAAETLLGQKGPLGGMREKTYRWKGSRLLVTYHPAACLRNPGYKRPVWEDMQRLAVEYLRD